MSANDKDVHVLLTVKNKDLQTFDTVESLEFDVKVSSKKIS